MTLPTLIWLGVPPVVANATATTMAVPGYCASVWAYRGDIRTEGALSLATIITLTALGGTAGAVLLTITSPDAFIGLVPWLVLTATLLFAFAPRLLKLSEAQSLNVHSPILAGTILLLVMIYGGYFNGGLGIIILAALSFQGYRNLHGMNGLKNLLSSVLGILSVITFTSAGLIAWDAAVPMAVANISGAYITARLVRQTGRADRLRFAIIAIGLAMTIAFFVT